MVSSDPDEESTDVTLGKLKAEWEDLLERRPSFHALIVQAAVAVKPASIGQASDSRRA